MAVVLLFTGNGPDARISKVEKKKRNRSLEVLASLS
jgi:hypothetical protein